MQLPKASTIQLAHSAAYAYRPLPMLRSGTDPTAGVPTILAQRLQERQVWGTALRLSGPPSLAALAEARRDGEVALWDLAAGERVMATCVITTAALDWHVAVLLPVDQQAPELLGEATGHLASAVFAAEPHLKEVWTALPLPEPFGDAEEEDEMALLSRGFQVVPSGVDCGQQRTYGLFRHIWRAYNETP